MQIHHRSTVSCDPDRIVGVLSFQPSDWLVPFLRIACSEAEHTLATPPDPRTDQRRTTSIQVRPPMVAIDGITLGFEWETEGYPGLFTTLRGRFHVAEADDGTAALDLSGATAWHDGRLDYEASARAARSLVDNLARAIEEELRAEV